MNDTTYISSGYVQQIKLSNAGQVVFASTNNSCIAENSYLQTCIVW